jgi:ribonucleoside-triphosphate reductase
MAAGESSSADCSYSQDKIVGKAKTSAIELDYQISPTELPAGIIDSIPTTPPQFGHGLLSQVVFYRTYSRIKSDGKPETWREVVIRVINGLWSIFSWHMHIHNLPIDSEWMSSFLRHSAESFYNMEWTPPGRGLWMMGTDFVYKRGATALNNCAAISTKNGVVESAAWAMDTLMNGGGVGFDTYWKLSNAEEMGVPARFIPLCTPHGHEWNGKTTHVIPDSREGWVWSVKLLLNSYLREIPEMANEYDMFPEFDYSLIRPRGSPIRGFGGIASGPEPLKKLHSRLNCFLRMLLPCSGMYIKPNPDGTTIYSYYAEEEFLSEIANIDYSGEEAEKALKRFKSASDKYARQRKYTEVRFITDVFNAIGDCVVSGNVRRSSEIAIGSPDDNVFLNLKNFQMYPEREMIAHNSNNSVRFTRVEQYVQCLPAIADTIRTNGEPGVLFQLNMTRFGRVSKFPQQYRGEEHGTYFQAQGMQSREFEEDQACLSNPCGEICLESGEFCNLSEVPLHRFLEKRGSSYDFMIGNFLQILEYATFYCKCVSLLPCQSQMTNAVIARNRRIGVSLSGVAVIYDTLGATKLINILKLGYRAVRNFDLFLSRMLGVVPSIRVTTCKPSGTVSLLTGATPGVHFPIGGRYAKRRVLIGNVVPLTDILKKAGVENEPAVYLSDSTCFTFYIDSGNARGQQEVSMYEMLTLVATVQREWADNMVSTTVSFNPEKEGPLLEKAIANFAPVLKSCAFLPSDCKSYQQMPYEAISREEYEAGVARIPAIDLEKLIIESGQQMQDPEAPKYCDGDTCLIRK